MSLDANHDILLEWMRPEQIAACREKADVALLPLGKLEWHGVQNPVGVDSLIPLHVCCAAVRKLGGGAVAPPLTWGVPRDSFDVGTGEGLNDRVAAAFGTDEARFNGFTPFGGLDRQDQWLFYQRLLRMAFEQVASFGFQSIYVCFGHAPLVHWVRPAAVAFCRASQMAGQAVTIDWSGPGHAGGVPADHGGKVETSFMMDADPACVDLDAFQRYSDYKHVGEGWDAEEATPAYGRELVERAADGIASEARWLVDNHPRMPARHSHNR
ncbi:MAG: creatininase family protein [Verrucomicrobia bacterium]|nr:creatininase family protein [Verrucomicrobiota bacterium]